MDSTDDKLPEAVVGDRLTAREETVAVAESLTGGLIGSRITDVPGASAYFDRAVVTYSNRSKQAALGVSREALDTNGAVSKAVAREMAAGVRDTAGTTWGVSTTGIAGPTGGTEENQSGSSTSALPTPRHGAARTPSSALIATSSTATATQ